MSNEITSVGRQVAPPPQELAGLRPARPAPAVEAKDGLAKETDKAAVRVQSEAARRDLQQAMERLNEQAKKSNYDLNFSLDKATQQVVVKVRNASSGEIIRQIPDDTVLHLARHLEDLKGLLHDKKI